MIEESHPNSVDLGRYSITHIEGLLYYFPTKLTHKLLEFHLSHNFSFKSSYENNNDFPLIYTALLGRVSVFSQNSTWDNKPYYFSGLNELTNDENSFNFKKEMKLNKICSSMNSHYSSHSNSDFPSPHLKLIYYLFDHDYTISSKSLNAIAKVELKTKNKELIHKAFEHCDLSNQRVTSFNQPIYCKTPLEIACKNGFIDIAKYLIKRGASFNVGGYNNCTSPLYSAMTSKNDTFLHA